MRNSAHRSQSMSLRKLWTTIRVTESISLMCNDLDPDRISWAYWSCLSRFSRAFEISILKLSSCFPLTLDCRLEILVLYSFVSWLRESESLVGMWIDILSLLPRSLNAFGTVLGRIRRSAGFASAFGCVVVLPNATWGLDADVDFGLANPWRNSDVHKSTISLLS